MAEFQIPYKYSPRDYQLEFLAAPQRFKIACWHRRGGKSKTVINEQIRKAVSRPGIYYYILPTYRQAKSVAWDELIKKHLPRDKRIVQKVNESELAIYYTNGSIQRFVGCEDIHTLRGINPIDVVFDEYSQEKEEVWKEIIEPVLAENGGTATFIFTPRGKNHSWRLLNMAKDNPNTWFTSIKTVYDTNGIKEEDLDRIRMTTPQAIFEQEYMCNFNDNAGQFFRKVRECVYEANSVPQPGHVYQIGIDLAKYNDFTVITPFDLNTFEVKTQDRFNQVDWTLQEARISANAFRYYNSQLILDRTGVGDSVVDHLEAQGLTIGEEGRFVFSAKSKIDLFNHLALLLEGGTIKIPDDPGLIAELESVTCELTEQGKMKIVTPKNSNDDRIMSLALAVWGCPDRPLGVKRLNIMNEFNMPIEDHEKLYEAI